LTAPARLRIPLTALFAALSLAVVMIVGSTLSYLQNQRAEQLAIGVTHSYRALAELEAVLPQVGELEDDLRMFVATGDRRYLERSAAGRTTLERNVAAYAEYARDQPLQDAQVEPLRKRLRERVDAIQATATAYLVDGTAGALREIQSGRGRASLQALDEQLARMKELERAALSKRVAEAQHAARLAGWAPVATATAGLLILAFGLRSLHRSARQHALAESRLEQTAEMLREADRRKDEFIATLAHELRNPLAPIRNAAAVLRQPAADARKREWAAGVIQRQVRTMALLLDDLLDVSRITRGTLTLHRRGVPLSSVVDAAVEIARPALDARRHQFEVRLPDAPVDLDVDPLRLSQVIANLLTNAAKYTDPGGHVSLQVEVGDERELRISVRDDGIGLSPESLREIFRMFSQVHASLERAEGGLGIGLALVKGLVELHGGHVEALSEGESRGSEFRVTLPGVVIASAGAVPECAQAAPAASAEPRRIVIADDSHDGAESLAMLLALAGHEVRVANDGASALRLLRESRPDVALLDIGMPELNGYQIAREIAGEPWREQLLLVAITGWGQDEDRRRALESGFDVHLTKPISPDYLAALVRTPRELRLAQ
jgi:signal transduction histidine kinase/ActR/RegA family two-component response regulator